MTRGELQRRDPAAYERLRTKGLLASIPRVRRVFDDPLAYYRRHYPGVARGELMLVDVSLYTTLQKAGLLRHLPPARPQRTLGDPLAYYRRHYPGVARGELRRCDPSLYNTLAMRGLLRHIPAPGARAEELRRGAGRRQHEPRQHARDEGAPQSAGAWDDALGDEATPPLTEASRGREGPAGSGPHTDD